MYPKPRPSARTRREPDDGEANELRRLQALETVTLQRASVAWRRRDSPGAAAANDRMSLEPPPSPSQSRARARACPYERSSTSRHANMKETE